LGRGNAVIAVFALVHHSVSAGLGHGPCAGWPGRAAGAGTATGPITIIDTGPSAGARTTTTVAAALALPAIQLRGHRGAGTARSREQNNRARQDYTLAFQDAGTDTGENRTC
jgi:hypothetical protein